MFPGNHPPEHTAAVLADTGETLTYGQLEENSIRLARVLHDAGLRLGDVVALLTDNDLRAFEVYWAALRSGLYVTGINHNLAADEVAYIINDSGAKAVVVSAAKTDLAERVVALTPTILVRMAFGGAVNGYGCYSTALAGVGADPLPDQPHGMPMLYSSGTTGTPKGVRPTLPEGQITEVRDAMTGLLGSFFGFGPTTTYLSPAPLYHAAPLRWCAAVQSFGGRVVVMKKFDAEASLQLIEKFRVTHAQFVPTMFVRMLKLPDAVRARHDVSSLQVAVHAAAPCPVEVKTKMIDWWGPILVEYYAGTEGNGMTIVDSPAWLDRPGTVGKSAIGVLHICDDNGEELPTGEIGTVYVEREGQVFTYHNDPDKTRRAQHPEHPNWSTLGDVGYVDAEGYLFLTDRKAFMIISGGVNIYPQETENVLALHPDVFDVAVIGLPDPEMGESVAAFVQPAQNVVPSAELGEELIAFVKSKIASYKAPRAVHFVQSLPRSETGKLVKRTLKDDFLSSTGH